MVSGGKNIAYKCPEADSNQTGEYEIYNNRAGRYFNTTSDGKHGKSTSPNSGRLHQTTGLDNLREDLHAERISKTATELITELFLVRIFLYSDQK